MSLHRLADVPGQLAELATWTSVHGEVIYGTRPWLVYGEGAVRTKGGSFKEDFKYSAKPDNTRGQNTVGFVKVWKVSAAGSIQPGRFNWACLFHQEL